MSKFKVGDIVRFNFNRLKAIDSGSLFNLVSKINNKHGFSFLVFDIKDAGDTIMLANLNNVPLPYPSYDGQCWYSTSLELDI